MASRLSCLTAPAGPGGHLGAQAGHVLNHGVVLERARVEELLAGVLAELGAHEGGVVVGAASGLQRVHGRRLRLPTAGGRRGGSAHGAQSR